MDFKNLNLELKSTSSTLKFNDTDISVLNYLPMKDKYDLIEVCIQDCIGANGILSRVKIEMIFNIYLVLFYTNIEFTNGELEDMFSLYDLMETNQLIDLVTSWIPESEYNYLKEELEKAIEDRFKYELSFRGSLTSSLLGYKKEIESLNNTIDDIDIEKAEEVLDVFKRVK